MAVTTEAFFVIWVGTATPSAKEPSCSISPKWTSAYFGGVLLPLAATLYIAFEARNLPTDFKESTFLFLSACLVTILWIFLIPAFYVMENIKKTILLALILTCQALVTLLCLFSRRVYFLVFLRHTEHGKRRLTSQSSRTRLGSKPRSNASSVNLGGSLSAISGKDTAEAVRQTTDDTYSRHGNEGQSQSTVKPASKEKTNPTTGTVVKEHML